MGAPEYGAYETYLDKFVTVLLRNGRFMYGILKSYDQYHSITLNFAVERVFLEGSYAERKHGLIILRGENIALIGLGEQFDARRMQKTGFEELVAQIDRAKADAGLAE
ncbi:U6 snRNA-associated Sm-like protein LSm1 [Pancytospora philotis]|nr:U6 snRNA-associated Sm-like protein LSm1 [Pancytospora philotis]